MALLITHPDYMIDPELIEVYRGFLAWWPRTAPPGGHYPAK